MASIWFWGNIVLVSPYLGSRKGTTLLDELQYPARVLLRWAEDFSKRDHPPIVVNARSRPLPGEAVTLVCDVLRGAGGGATWASCVLRRVVGSEPGNIRSCEGVVNSYLEGSRGDPSRINGLAGFLSLVVLYHFHRRGPEGVVVPVRGAGEGVVERETAGFLARGSGRVVFAPVLRPFLVRFDSC